ncbi:MAG TPA: thiamine pyrophosphate-binding protein [Candidatus Dormibacteraeota bacterium]|nr:thiamine pyrophosphate-binding protein [Candidatus Dormibacteraeota bacterium]
MRVAEALGRAIAQLGVRDAFGLVGSGNFHLTNAMRASGVRFIAARHETGVVTMADAYARAGGRLGVATVHQGPGVTNALTGLTEAAKSRTPLLLLAAEATAPLSNFYIDVRGAANASGAVHLRIDKPVSAVADLARAAQLAVGERRTVLVSLPLEVQAAECDPAIEVQPPLASPPKAAATADVEALVRMLADARRPLILAGRGAVLSGARAPLELLADQTGALLATSAVAAGLFTGSPWNLGISGGFASPVAAELIESSDVIVAFGASLNMWTTRRGHLIGREAKVAQVDVDPAVLGAHRPVDLRIEGDCAATARALSEALGSHHAAGRRSDELRNRIEHGGWREEPFEDMSGDGHIDPRTLSIALQGLLPRERTLAVDSGHFMGWPPMYLDVPDGGSFVFTQSFMSIGLGLATGLGAAVARPDRLTVIALGDGGALMSLPELETLGRLGLDALVVVYNDASYAAEVHHFAPEGAPMDTVRFPDTDFAALARSVGLEAATVRSLGDVEAVRDWLDRGRPKPLLVDAKVVPTVVAEWLEEAFRGH